MNQLLTPVTEVMVDCAMLVRCRAPRSVLLSGRNQFGDRSGPLFCGCGHDHGSGRSACLAHGHPVHRGGDAATGKLFTKLCLIGHGLFHADSRPRNVQFLSNQHWQHGLDALADLGILRGDCDCVIGIELNIGGQF